jgi:hypothetical protein
VRIVGTNFYNVRAVRIGRMVIASVKVLGPKRIEITTPAHKRPGALDVTVHTQFGTTPVSPADRYTYDAPS